jgi:hypothetical protein
MTACFAVEVTPHEIKTEQVNEVDHLAATSSSSAFASFRSRVSNPSLIPLPLVAPERACSSRRGVLRTSASPRLAFEGAARRPRSAVASCRPVPHRHAFRKSDRVNSCCGVTSRQLASARQMFEGGPAAASGVQCIQFGPNILRITSQAMSAAVSFWHSLSNGRRSSSAIVMI